MTEQEWLASNYPQKMLDYLRGKPTDRKLRLFAIACCRRTLPLLNETSRQVVEAGERYVEGLATPEQLRPLVARAQEISSELDPGYDPNAADWEECALMQAAHAAWWPALTDHEAWQVAGVAARSAATALGISSALDTQSAESLGPVANGNAAVSAAEKREAAAQSELLRDIFGSAFRPVTLNPAWQTSNVIALAQAIYDDRAFERLPILADALEDAGCDNADILHCRQPGVHVRGCWVVDLVLAKE